MTLIILILFALFFILVAWSYWGTIWHASVSKRVIALTFDDGPHPEATAALLDVLQGAGAKATFFVCGKHVTAYPDIIARIHQAGHEIGNHGMDHRYMIGFAESSYRVDIEQCNTCIETVTGKPAALFRPPYLLQGPGLRVAARNVGMPSIIGSAVTTDWISQRNSSRIAWPLKKLGRSGGIVILHDGHAGAKQPFEQDDRWGTVEAAKEVIRHFQGKGYSFVTVSELLSV